MIVSFHLQRFYIWILIFHHQPIRPPSHQRGRDPPVMAGADSRFHRCYQHAATAATTQGTRWKLSLFWWFLQNSGNKGLLAGFSKWCWLLRGFTELDNSQYPWEGCWWSGANRQPETTFSHKVREVSNQQRCHRRSSMGIVGGIGPDHRNSGSAARQPGPGPKHV